MSQKQQPPRRFYRVREIMALTGVSKGKVYQALRDGRLKGLKLDGVLLIPAESFETWIAEALPWETRSKTANPHYS